MSERRSIVLVEDQVGAAGRLINTIRSLSLDAELVIATAGSLELAPHSCMVLLPLTSQETGFGLMRRLRSLEVQLPVVFFALRPSLELVAQASIEGAFDVLDLHDDARIVERSLVRALSRRPALLNAHATRDARLRSTIESLLDCQAIAHVGSFEVNVKTGQIERSPEFCRILGIKADEPPLTLQTYVARVHRDDRARVTAEMKMAFQKGTFDSHYRLVHKNSRVVFVHARGRVEHAQDGAALRVLGVVQDVSEVQKLQSQLEAFVQSVAHDLRSPLTIMVGFASLIEEYADSDELLRIRQHAGHIVTTGRRLQHLIGAFLDLSRSTHAELERANVDVSEAAENAYARMQPNAGLTPLRSLSVEPGMIAGADAALLDILLTNLLENAIKYSAPVSAPSIKVGKVRGEKGEAFFVADNGVGFDPVHASRLFTPFSRLHSGSEFEGNGLGLATCDRIVKRHGGSIWVHTQQGMGTTIYFTLGPDHESV